MRIYMVLHAPNDLNKNIYWLKIRIKKKRKFSSSYMKSQTKIDLCPGSFNDQSSRLLGD